MKKQMFGSKSQYSKRSDYNSINCDDIDRDEVDTEIKQYLYGDNDHNVVQTGSLTSEMNDKKYAVAADLISERLLSMKGKNNADLEHKIIRESLYTNNDESFPDHNGSVRRMIQKPEIYRKIVVLLSIAVTIIFFLLTTLVTRDYITATPPKQPTGPYTLLEVQEGEDFLNYYEFFEGPDSLGSAGYNNYISRTKARHLGIFNVSKEVVEPVYNHNEDNKESLEQSLSNSTIENEKEESFIYMSSAPTNEGHRDSIRLEGHRRFNRGLFIIDIRHMPAGCGTWPAFWMTDEEKWPLNGEIDIIEGVNTQTVAKTSLHSTKHCTMDDVPPNSRTGKWDIAQGVPDVDGNIDMTAREVTDCFVWNPHQWLNSGCVTVSEKDGTLGTPLNEKGGGVFVLEWDPINFHLRSWVFAPHLTVPTNLRESIQTASNTDEKTRVMPDPSLWGLPFGYFPIGTGTKCPSKHFQDMRLIFNLAFCGSVSGARFFIDCPVEFKQFGSDKKSCEKYIASNPDALKEAYWKIRGVYIYERKWEEQ